MEKNNTEFDEQASLLLITSMINKAQNHFQSRAFLYLLWGWTIFGCSVVHFVLLHWHLVDTPERIWGLTWLALIYQVFYIIKKRRTARVKTYTNEIIAQVWLVFVVCSVLCTFLLTKNNAWSIMYPVFFVLYGIPTYLSGVIMKFTPLKIGAISCWILSIIGSFVSTEYQLLLLTAAMVIAWIIPGYLMQSKFKSA